MDIQLALTLPRDSITVPLVRHLTKHALWEINVTRECVGDIELAVTEACANVIDHAGVDSEYAVHIDIDDRSCAIRVVDDGHGFDYRSFEGLDPDDVDPDSARGRGLQLMHRLVDAVELESESEVGTVVRLTKQLRFDEPGPRFLRRDAVATMPPSRHR